MFITESIAITVCLQNRVFICPCFLHGSPAFVSYSYAKIFAGPDVPDEWIHDSDVEGQ